MPRSHKVAIARSGVQYYMREELPTLGLTSIPRELSHLRVFGVYRPSYAVQLAAPMYKGAPVAVGHSRWFETPDDPNIIGRTGDEVEVKVHNEECTVFGTLMFSDDRFEDSKSDVSPGYKGINVWMPGKTTDGVEFQIVMKKITEVNHLALVPKGRAGNSIKILDGGSKVSKERKIFSGLLRYARKLAHGTKDADMGSFRNTVEDVLENRTRWTPEEMDEHCVTLTTLTNDLPDSDEKNKLLRFIADLPLVAGEDDETAKQVGTAIADLYEQLDSDAMTDVIDEKGESQMPTENHEASESPAVEAKEEAAVVGATADSAIPPASTAPAEPQASNPAETSAEGAVSPEKAMYTLKEIYLLLGKLFSGEPATTDAPAQGAPVPPVAATAMKEEPAATTTPAPEEERRIGDSLPSYTQSLSTHASANSLDDTFNKMKGVRNA